MFAFYQDLRKPPPNRPAAGAVAVLVLSSMLPLAISADPVPVRHAEGVTHGFLFLRNLEGVVLASGDVVQVARGERVTSRLTFNFKDGSLHDETAVFSQQKDFRLLTYHLTQKGPSFPHAIEVSIDVAQDEVTVRYTGSDGKEKIETQHPELPPDLANGMTLTLLKNISPGTPETKVSMLAASPKPRLVKLAITAQGEERFFIGNTSRKATKYTVKVEIGGISGVVAPLVGKQPADTHVWILGGQAPCFVKSEGPLYAEGPVWRIELLSPTWPQASSSESSKDR